jgi:hypothetical protein
MTSGLIRSERTEKGLGGTFRWERVALASGILFVAVQVATVVFNVAFFLTTHPPIDASPQETARGFAEHATMVEVGTYLYVLHMPFWLLFLGGLFGVLRRAVAGSSPSPCSAGESRWPSSLPWAPSSQVSPPRSGSWAGTQRRSRL